MSASSSVRSAPFSMPWTRRKDKDKDSRARSTGVLQHARPGDKKNEGNERGLLVVAEDSLRQAEPLMSERRYSADPLPAMYDYK